MNVFISWSSIRSQHIATAVRDWLPNVIQALKPFISSQDITTGTRGEIVIAQELAAANVGIICLTPENVGSPWLNFEGGALSKLSSSYVCTYLYELEPGNVPRPLGQFQHSKADKVGTKKLLDAVNSGLQDARLENARLDTAFETWWPRLEDALNRTPPRPETEPVPTRSENEKLDELLELMRARKMPPARHVV